MSFGHFFYETIDIFIKKSTKYTTAMHLSSKIYYYTRFQSGFINKINEWHKNIRHGRCDLNTQILNQRPARLCDFQNSSSNFIGTDCRFLKHQKTAWNKGIRLKKQKNKKKIYLNEWQKITDLQASLWHSTNSFQDEFIFFFLALKYRFCWNGHRSDYIRQKTCPSSIGIFVVVVFDVKHALFYTYLRTEYIGRMTRIRF